MKIIVFGAGAIGSLLGALLSARNDVALIGRAAHMDAIRDQGLAIEGQRRVDARLQSHTSAEDIVADPDLILLTVKAYDTATALEQLQPLVGPHTILLTGQNGLGNWELARQRYPDNPVLGATTTLGVALQRPGTIRWNGDGEIVVGGDPQHKAAIDRLVDEFRHAGLTSTSTNDLPAALWRKAVVNAAINPLTALHRIPNGRLLDDASLRRTMQDVCNEAVRVANAEGIRLDPTATWELVETVARRTAANRSSMLQSVERGQRTEIDAINGAILRAAKHHGIACPENQRLYDAVRALERR